MFAIMCSKADDKVVVRESFGSGKIQGFLSEQSAKHGVWIVGGTVPIACDIKNKIKAASLVYDNEGNCVARYDKMHLFDVTLSQSEFYRESDSTEPGDEMVVVDTPVGKLGLSVCYDIRFPALYTQLSDLGAEIMVIPAAFTLKTGEAHWQLLARARAVENFCYVIGACQGGTHVEGRQTYGHSLIVHPWGNVIQEVTSLGKAVIYADVDLQELHKIRESIPVFEQRSR